MQHTDLVVGAGPQRNKVMRRLVAAILMNEPGEQATLPLARIAADDQVAARRLKQRKLSPRRSQLAGAANEGGQAAGDKAGVVVQQGA